MGSDSEFSQWLHTGDSDSDTASIIEVEPVEDSAASDGTFPPDLELLATLARKGLRSLFQDPTVVEKSREQLRYLMACLECREDIQVVLPTGGGKSAGWLVPAVLYPQRTSIVVTPYTLLLEDQLQSARGKGILTERFTARGPQLPDDVQLVFMQPETVASRSF